MSLLIDQPFLCDEEVGNLAGTWTAFPSGRVFDCEVVILKEEEGFSAQCSRLPGVAGEGETVAEAVKNIAVALNIALKLYLEEGSIPWEDNPIDGDVECKKRILINA